MTRQREEGWSPPPGEQLRELPQKFDVWQMDARHSGPLGAWIVVTISHSEDKVVGLELLHEPPAIPRLWQALARAMTEPGEGEPHRPTEVQVRDERWAEGLRPLLQDINVGCVVAAELDQMADAFDGLEAFAAQLPMPETPGLLDMPGLTAEAVASFFDAAALFHEQAPWRRVGERPIQVACDKFDSGPWYAVLMGQAGMTSGLVLYDDLDTLHRIQEGGQSEEESARITAALTVVFGGVEDMAPADLEALRQHGWRMAGPDAYPSVYRMEPGLSMRPPLAWELELLEGCLRAVPEFVRKKNRRFGPTSIAVPVASGELSLVLAWADEP